MVLLLVNDLRRYFVFNLNCGQSFGKSINVIVTVKGHVVLLLLLLLELSPLDLMGNSLDAVQQHGVIVSEIEQR